MGSFSTRLKSRSFAFTLKALLLLIGTHCRVSLLSTGRLNTCEFFLFDKMLSGLVLIIQFFFREKGFTLLLKPTMSNGRCYLNETVLTIDFIMLYFNLLVAPFHGNRITWGKIRKQEKKYQIALKFQLWLMVYTLMAITGYVSSLTLDSPIPRE